MNKRFYSYLVKAHDDQIVAELYGDDEENKTKKKKNKKKNKKNKKRD
jgi:hypothetical protein